MATLAAGGCDPGGGGSDGETDSGSDTDGANPSGEGQFVQCCYLLGNDDPDAREGCVPQNNPYHACVVPDDVLDLDASGDVDQSEFAEFCDKKVPKEISTFDPWVFPFLQPDGESPLDINGPWTSANSTGGSIFGSCVPDINPEVDYPGGVVSPSHEGSFTDTAPHSSSVDVGLDGVHQVMPADGKFELAVSDCESVRHLETCYVEFRYLRVDLRGPASFADYSLDTVELFLQEVATTPVTFDCSDGLRCVGSFDFSTRTGTSLDAVLQWDQTDLNTGSVSGGLLRLGENGLAQMSRVLGELDLDLEKQGGSMRLRGSGSDSFGGSFANIEFDLAGPVSLSAIP